MRINLAVWDSFLRILIGTLITSWAIAGGPIWAYFGLVLIGTGAWRFDPVYAILRISTLKS